MTTRKIRKNENLKLFSFSLYLSYSSFLQSQRVVVLFLRKRPRTCSPLFDMKYLIKSSPRKSIFSQRFTLEEKKDSFWPSWLYLLVPYPRKKKKIYIYIFVSNIDFVLRTHNVSFQSPRNQTLLRQ